ncbi:hypothetical protein QBC47DRAFT_161483 [Echria macrotheca]|uniref:Uncharacterized protein n=1 Tax=Echria macrotheca TaxID=438768 RepID=A0AAJ0BKL5_9PEZI|nr:hypothetical protein QBC47DRAFT_161483 [Echria macrotheca]
MSSYDPYDSPTRERTKRYYREERRDDRDPRYDTRDSYLSVSRDLVPRAREDSDLSVEEIRRDFPPPGYSSRDIRRARSAGGYYDGHDDRRYDRDYDTRSRKADSVYYEEEHRKKVRMLNKQEQIIAAITGAAIAIGGKELFDRRDAKLHDADVKRNPLASAALGAAGAFAGYQGTEFYNKYREKEEKKTTVAYHRGRDGKIEYYSDDEESVKEKKGHKNFLEAALAAAGLGGAVKALTGGGGRDDRSERSGTRSRRSSGSSTTSRSKGGKSDAASKIQKAAMASLIAGATEAFRVSKEPGGWKGEKAKRILTAAAGAATIDAAQKTEKAGTKLGLAESVIGGLVGNRVINGSKKNIEEDEKTGRSRSRSRARSSSRGGAGGVSGLAALATAGLGAIGAKKVLDGRDRSKSRGRSDSEDSRGESTKRRHRSRSRSVVDSARRGLAKLGIGNGPEDDEDDGDRRGSSRRGYDDYDDQKSSRRHRDSYDDYDRDRSSHGHDRHRDRDRGTIARRGSASSSDLGDSDEDRKRQRKMRGKQIITTGLAAVATIHAAANVYQSMEKRKARQKAVREGRLSEEAAEKMKSRAILQDTASIGIAALGIKGAISELKEARESVHEMREWKEKREERHKRRLERQRRLTDTQDRDGYGRRRADNWSSPAPPKADHYDDGPRYTDGNPYAALPPPGDRR